MYGSAQPACFSDIRIQLNRASHGGYGRFLKSLTPRYVQVWRDILLGYAALAVTLALAARAGCPWMIPAAALGAIAIGYGIAYIQLFIHEAAHYNIAPSRKWNDRLGDLFIAWQVGGAISRYRETHLRHHLALGGVEDSERSYFRPLTPRLVFEMLTGLHAVRVFLGREGAPAAEPTPETRGLAAKLRPLLRGVAIHATLLLGLASLHAWAAMFAWIAGMGVVFPFFATLRQLLEHRSAAADPQADYSVHPHGAHTRLFADGPIAATLGGAGFSRHLLHHWEPHISYTRLEALEAHLLQTPAAAYIAANRTTYLAALRDIWRNDNRLDPAAGRAGAGRAGPLSYLRFGAVGAVGERLRS